jgi:hypothetical protein
MIDPLRGSSEAMPSNGPGYESLDTFYFRQPWPLAVVVLAILAALAIAAILYLAERSLPRWKRILLGSLRAVMLILIILLLLEPVGARSKRVTVPGNILVLVDVSESMSIAEQRNRPEDLEEAALALGNIRFADRTVSNEVKPGVSQVARLDLARGILKHPELSFWQNPGDKHRLRFFTFGDQLQALPEDPREFSERLAQLDATAPETRMGDSLHQAMERYKGQPLAGVVVLADGASNKGLNPLDLPPALRGVPIFPIGLGLHDPDDLELLGTVGLPNLIVPRDPKKATGVPEKEEVVTFHVPLRATPRYLGESVVLTVKSVGGEVLTVSEPVKLTEASWTERGQLAKLSFPKPEAGGLPLLKLDISVSTLAGEVSTENNRITESVKVANEKINVLLVEGKPRWEFRYLRRVLEGNPDRFKLTEATLHALQRDGLPGPVLAKLEGLKDKDFAVRDEIVKALAEPLKDDLARYRDLILDHAGNQPLLVRFLLTEGDPDLVQASHKYLDRFPDKEEAFFRYDMIILGDVPADHFTPLQRLWLKKLVADMSGSFLMLAGDKHAPMSYAGKQEFAELLPVKIGVGLDPVKSEVHLVAKVDEDSAASDRAMMELGSSPDEMSLAWSKARPLHYLPRLDGAKEAAVVLATLSDQANQANPYPLIAWHRYGKGTAMFVGTANLWRMREYEGNKYHSQFWEQAIKFLALARLEGENKPIRLGTGSAKRFPLGDRVPVYATVRRTANVPGDSRETFDVQIKAASGQRQPRRLTLHRINEQEGVYQGFFRADHPGEYHVAPLEEFKAISNQEQFLVEAVSQEKRQPRMQKKVLEDLALLSGGKFLSARDLPSLPDLIADHSKEVTLPPQETELWNNWLVYFVLLLLAGAEWFIRRQADVA